MVVNCLNKDKNFLVSIFLKPKKYICFLSLSSDWTEESTVMLKILQPGMKSFAFHTIEMKP